MASYHSYILFPEAKPLWVDICLFLCLLFLSLLWELCNRGRETEDEDFVLDYLGLQQALLETLST